MLLETVASKEGAWDFHVVEMDLKDDKSIKSVFDYVSSMQENLTLHAVVNNAGVMCFGEFEWLSHDIIEEQMRVNVLGPMTLVKYFLPMIRQQKSRIIVVTSHCTLKALPGISVYSASKASLRFWSEALEQEMHKFGVSVINFIPGSFVMSSNIAARTTILARRMRESLSEEQLGVYGEYFDQYYRHLSRISNYKSPSTVQFDKKVISKLMQAILDEFPKCVYKEEPWKFTFFYGFFKILPQGHFLERWLMKKFLKTPTMAKRE